MQVQSKENKYTKIYKHNKKNNSKNCPDNLCYYTTQYH